MYIAVNAVAARRIYNIIIIIIMARPGYPNSRPLSARNRSGSDTPGLQGENSRWANFDR